MRYGWPSALMLVPVGLLEVVAAPSRRRRTSAAYCWPTGAPQQRRSGRMKDRALGTADLAGIAIPPPTKPSISSSSAPPVPASRPPFVSSRRAIARGDRAVFADPDGGYWRDFYDRYRGDIVLNPFERDSVKWDLFAEIQNSYDVEQLASGLIRNSEDPSAQRVARLCADLSRCRGAALPSLRLAGRRRICGVC